MSLKLAAERPADGGRLHYYSASSPHQVLAGAALRAVLAQQHAKGKHVADPHPVRRSLSHVAAPRAPPAMSALAGCIVLMLALAAVLALYGRALWLARGLRRRCASLDASLRAAHALLDALPD